MDVCRICFANIGTIDIFDNEQGISVSSKIMYCCASIRIYREDGLPVRVCTMCDLELSLAYKFVLKCEAADKKLHLLNQKEHVKPEIKMEDDKIEFEDSFTDKPDSNRILEIQKYEESTEENTLSFPKLTEINTVKKKKIRKVGGPQKCKECGRQCSSQSNLIIHMRSHSNERPYACESCDKTYKDKGGLKRHIETNHNQDRKREVICEFCGKAFFSYAEVKTHTRTHTGETPYACSLCPSKFTQVSALLRHQLRHTGEKAHSCLKCNKKFSTKVELNSHQIAHTSEKKFICVICNGHFKYASNLRKHVLLHTSRNSFICDYCGRSFGTKGNLKIHIKNLHSGKSGICNFCSKHVPNIEIHMWKHTGKRPLQCDFCPSSFFAKKSLTRHINFKHMYSDKFKCIVNGCKCHFPSQSMLEYHVAKYHGSSIPFPCDTCSKGFYRRSDLSRHKLRYHK